MAHSDAHRLYYKCCCFVDGMTNPDCTSAMTHHADKQDFDVQMMQKQTCPGCTALCSMVWKNYISIRLSRRISGSACTLQLSLYQKAAPGSQVSSESGSPPAKSSQHLPSQVSVLQHPVCQSLVIAVQAVQCNTDRHCKILRGHS